MNRFVLTLVGLGASLVGPVVCGGQADDAPTFSRDIAPIVFKNCVSCHRAGGSAPFSLETYEAVSTRARQIADVTESKEMPPWLPKRGYGDFAGARRLSPAEIRTLRKWSDEPLSGDAAETPTPPELTGGWQLGEPDLIVSMPRSYTLPPGGRDVYRNFVLPIPLDSPRFVRAIEFRPGGAHIVHHARILIDRNGGSRELDARDDEPGYDGMIVDKAEFPDGLFLGWAPGKVPAESDEALVWRLLPGTDLVVQAHMMTSDTPQAVDVSVGFFFTDKAPERRAAVLQLGSKTIDIPAGARAHAIEDSYTLPADVDVIGIYPHAHYICHEMQVKAHFPDGSEQWLLWIPEWDFYWQDEYRFETPVSLPRGTTITMRFVYDNSSDNSLNPFEPPQRIRFGPMSTDEMGDVLLMVVPRDPKTLTALQEDFLENELRQDIAGYEKMLYEDPDDAQVHNALGFAYSSVGRTDDAIAEWQHAIRLRPDFAEAHYNLGGALAGQRRYEEAARAFRDAIDAYPAYAEAYNNLGVILQSDGQLSKAIDQYQKAIEIRPDYAFAHHNLGNAFLAEGKLERALEQLRTAVRIEPDYAEAHYSLGSALGRQGQLEDEIAHYRLAIEAKPDYPQALHNLGVVLMLTDRPDEAVAPLREAVRIRPDYALATANLARALAATSKSNDPNGLDESLRLFRRAIAQRPEDAATHRDLASTSKRSGNLDTALTHYRIAVELAPTDPAALAGLAWVLAVHRNDEIRNPKTALQLAKRASRLTPDPDAATWDALAAAYASAGHFPEALRAGEKALAAAKSSGKQDLVPELEARLELYRNETPYLAPQSSP